MISAKPAAIAALTELYLIGYYDLACHGFESALAGHWPGVYRDLMAGYRHLGYGQEQGQAYGVALACIEAAMSLIIDARAEA